MEHKSQKSVFQFTMLIAVVASLWLISLSSAADQQTSVQPNCGDKPCNSSQACIVIFFFFPGCQNLAKEGEFCSPPSSDGKYTFSPPCGPNMNCSTTCKKVEESSSGDNSTTTVTTESGSGDGSMVDAPTTEQQGQASTESVTEATEATAVSEAPSTTQASDAVGVPPVEPQIPVPYFI